MSNDDGHGRFSINPIYPGMVFDHVKGRWKPDGDARKARGNGQDAAGGAIANLPEIHISQGALEEIVNDVERALMASGRGLYQRRNEIVSAEQAKIEVRDGKIVDAMIIAPRGARALIEDLSACAIIQRWDNRAKKHVACDAPMAVVQTLQQRIGRLNFPVLTGLVFAPTMRPDGSVLDAPGYDAMTGLLYDPMGVTFPLVPPSPSRDDAEKALAVLMELIATFPFVDDADKSVALSAILTACGRPAFPHAPLHAFTAPTAGTGKSKLVDIASVIATGHECRVTAMGRSEDELEKRLASLMIEGDNMITIDNCETPLGANDFLCQMLTQPVVKPRILGKSQSPECSTTKVFIAATGNNLQITGDMPRRAVLCSLDAKMERPELREFKVDPVSKSKKNRPQLVVAALTKLRAYICADKPDQGRTPLGSFEDWSGLVRSALIWLGMVDPVDTMEKIRELDPEKEALQEFVSQWKAAFGSIPTTIVEAVKAVTETVDEGYGLPRRPKNPALHDAFTAIAGVSGGAINNRKLGKYMARNMNKITSGYVLRKCGTANKNKVVRWKVEVIEPPRAACPSGGV